MLVPRKAVNIAAALLAALTLAAALCAALNKTESVYTAAEPYSALRLHVIAESDGAEDQEVKLAVRDAVLEAARAAFTREEVDTPQKAREILMKAGSSLQRAAERTLNEAGMDYGAQLVLGRFDFPDRVYGGMLYPAGTYDALRIILGDGAGRNWWCVMFPPLCIIESEDAPAEYEEDGTLRFKSLVAELWRRLFAGGEP